MEKFKHETARDATPSRDTTDLLLYHGLVLHQGDSRSLA